MSCDEFLATLKRVADGAGSESDREKLATHMGDCPRCAQSDDVVDLAILALASPDEELDPGPDFDQRIVKAWRRDRSMKTVAFWQPAIVGAAVACIALLAILQMVTAGKIQRSIDLRGQEARNEAPAGPEIPAYREGDTTFADQ